MNCVVVTRRSSVLVEVVVLLDIVNVIEVEDFVVLFDVDVVDEVVEVSVRLAVVVEEM